MEKIKTNCTQSIINICDFYQYLWLLSFLRNQDNIARPQNQSLTIDSICFKKKSRRQIPADSKRWEHVITVSSPSRRDKTTGYAVCNMCKNVRHLCSTHTPGHSVGCGATRSSVGSWYWRTHRICRRKIQLLAFEVVHTADFNLTVISRDGRNEKSCMSRLVCEYRVPRRKTHWCFELVKRERASIIIAHRVKHSPRSSIFIECCSLALSRFVCQFFIQEKIQTSTWNSVRIKLPKNYSIKNDHYLRSQHVVDQ